MSATERRIAELEDELHQCRHLLKQQMRTGESLECEAIVNREGVPLINFRWDQLAAQIPVNEARQLLYRWLRVCEWADTDATMLRGLRDELDFEEATIAGFMAMMREARGGHKDSAG